MLQRSERIKQRSALRPCISRPFRLKARVYPNRPARKGLPWRFFSLIPTRTGRKVRQSQKGRQAQESQMPKLKTKSGAKKRFKITGTGKVVYAQAGKQHGMIKRTTKQIRNLRGTAVLFKTDGEKVKKFFLPNG
jgi:large subunit ribosomal protein L35